MTLIELALQVHTHLRNADLPHAFGGALALAYVADPRGTVDIDINVFVTVDEIDTVLEALAPLQASPEQPLDTWMPSAGLRLRTPTEPFPIDVFVSLDSVYDEIRRRSVEQPLGPRRTPVPVLSADDLAVFKLSFGRDKDWVDLRAMARAVELDVPYIERQILALRGPSMHPRLARLRQITRREQ
ncbi:MAG: nucleotidyl transferase AbiEii/AbiGii toxin family protein [Acidimicrobiia bacterium]|nr:nucleotidyl transferase AbiEii/AbiGii toxin family protein [Acidimicrobiia bacterium]